MTDATEDAPLTWARVAERLREMGRGAPYQLAQRLQMNPSYLYRKLKTQDVLREDQGRLVRAFLSQEEAAAPARPEPAERGPARLPVYGYAAAGGEERIAFAEGEVIDELALPMGLSLGPGDYFVVRPTGSSMEPRIFPGEDLVVRRGFPPRRDKDVVVEFSDGTALVKTYKGQRDGRLFLEQFNPPRMLDFDASSVRAIHAVAFKL